MLNKPAKYAVEDTSRGVANLVPGNIKSAEREAFSISAARRVIVNIYVIEGQDWTLYAQVKP